jgi:uncharacterized membrane protein
MKDSHGKSVLKSIVWRIIGVFWLSSITWLFTRRWIHVSLITFIHHAVFIVVFYLHERAWINSKMRPKIRYDVKAFTYEIILGNLILGLITYAVTRSPYQMTMITFTYIQSKLILYYFYDWLWTRQ